MPGQGLTVGVAHIDIVPNLAGFGRKLQAEVNQSTRGVGKSASQNISHEINAGTAAAGGGLKRFGGITTLATAGAGAAILGFAKSSVDRLKAVAGESMRLARVMGGSAEEASKWRGAMQLAGLDATTAEGAMRKFSTAIVKSDGPLQKLGVNTRDAHGKIRATGDVLLDVADKFKAMPAGAEKSAAAVQLFGKKGLELMPFLNRGASGIKALEAKAKDLGITLDSKTINSVKEMSIKQREFKASTDGLKIAVGTALLPILVKLSGLVTAHVIPAIRSVGRFFKEHKATVVAFGNAAGKVAQTIGRFLAPAFKDIAQFVTRSIVPALRNLWAVFNNSIKPVLVTIGTIVTGVVLVAFRVFAAILRNVIGPAIKSVTGFLKEHKAIVGLIATAVLTLVTILGVWKVAQLAINAAQKIGAVITRGVAIAQRLLNLVMNQNPIMRVVTVILVLVAVFIYAWKNCDTFRKIVTGVFNAVKHVIVGVITWIGNFFKSHWPLILALLTGPIGLLVLWVIHHWDKIKGIITGVLTAIGDFFKAHWPLILAILTLGISAIITWFVDHWDKIKKVFTGAINAIGDFFKKHWPLILAILTGGIGLLVLWMVRHWDKIKAGVKALVDAIRDKFQWVKDRILAIWNGIKDMFTRVTAWLHDVIAARFQRFTENIHRAFVWVKDKLVGIWNTIKGIFTGVVNFLHDTIKGGIDRFTDGIRKAFNWVKDRIFDAWNGIKKICAVPINFVINTVYNKGIRWAWNHTFGLIPGVPDLPAATPIPGYARGGPLTGGTPGRDSIPLGPITGLGMPGEWVMRRAAVDKYGHSGMAAINAGLVDPAALGVPGYGVGGFIKGVGHAIAHPLDTIKDAAGHIMEWGRGIAGRAIDGLLKPLRNVLNGFLGTKKTTWSGGMNEAVQQTFTKMTNFIKGKDTEEDKKKAALDDSGGGSRAPGAGVERWRGTFLQALALTGYPSLLIDLGLQRLGVESGGNDRAINLWDSNAKAGTPSKGLMQCIDSTFRAWHEAGTSNDIYDPLANICASINYTAHLRKGFEAWKGTAGYAAGGRPRVGQWSLVGENGPELFRADTPGRVFSNADSRNLMGRHGGKGGPLIGTAYIREDADAELLAKKLSFLERSGVFA